MQESTRMDPPKPRRFARACDNCHRRRVKCYWRPPACPDCEKKGIECTFTTIKKASLASEASANGNEQAREAQRPTESRRTAPAARAASRDEDVAMHDRSSIQQPTTTASSGRTFLILIDEYFKKTNHYFPIYNQDLFLQRMMNPSSTMTEIGSVVESIIECSVHQHRAMNATHGDSTAISQANERADTTLKAAIASSPKLLFTAPSVSHLQALTLLSTCLLHSPGHHKQAGSHLLAAAIRMSHTLGIHHLDDHPASSLDPADRLEQLRCFWCLYILDQEISLRTQVPPLLDAADLRLPEPHVVSNDRCGIIGRLDGAGFVNFFAARQRLARIGAAIRADLCPRNSSLHSQQSGGGIETRADVIALANRRLAAWMTDWFAYGGTVEIRSRWSKEAIPLIVGLQLTYFLHLLRANPDVPSDVEAGERVLAAAEVEVSSSGGGSGFSARRPVIPRVCVDAARDTLRLGTSVSWSAMPHLGDILQTAVPAVLVMLFGYFNEEPGTRNRLDLALADGWVTTIGRLAEAGNDDQLRRVHSLCVRLGSRNPFESGPEHWRNFAD